MRVITIAQIAHQAVDHTPAWLAFVGAVIVASVAAATAQYRQSRQLRHDRELKDLEELRSLLDECAKMAGTTSQLLNFMLARASDLPRKDDPEESASRGRPMLLRELGVSVQVTDSDYSAIDPDFQSLEDAFYKSAEPVFGLYQRIILRLGEEHPVSHAFLELELQWVGLGISALLAGTEPSTEDRSFGIDYVRSEIRDAHFAFLEASHALVRSQIDGPRKRFLSRGAAQGAEDG